LKAIYGFRCSPKLWKDYRDEELEKMKIKGMRLHQLESEPSTWAIPHEETSKLQGLLLMYVDDVLVPVPAPEEVAEAWVSRIQSKWEISTAEKVGYQQTWEIILECGICSSALLYTLGLLQKNMRACQRRKEGRNRWSEITKGHGQVAMILGILSRARAQDEEGGSAILFDMMMIYILVVALITAQLCWQ